MEEETISREDEKEFYRKTLHSKLLCGESNCDICHPPLVCGWEITNYPVNTAGENKIWRCFCPTTACQKQPKITN